MIQVNPQNINEVLASFETRLTVVEERSTVFQSISEEISKGNANPNSQLGAVEGMLIALATGAIRLLEHYNKQNVAEIEAIRHTIDELKEVKAKMDSGLVIPNGPLPTTPKGKLNLVKG